MKNHFLIIFDLQHRTLPSYFCVSKTHRRTNHYDQSIRHDHIEVEKPQLSKTNFQILSYYHFFDQNLCLRPFPPAGSTSSIMPQYYSLELVITDTKMLYESLLFRAWGAIGRCSTSHLVSSGLWGSCARIMPSSGQSMARPGEEGIGVRRKSDS